MRKTKDDYLIELYQAVEQRKQILIMMYCEDTEEMEIITNSDDIDDCKGILNAFQELPFTGRVYQEDVFDKWYEFLEDVKNAEIYGFELEDGSVQVAITPYDSIEKQAEEQRN